MNVMQRLAAIAAIVRLAPIAAKAPFPQQSLGGGAPAAQGHYGRSQGRHGAKGPLSPGGRRNALGRYPHQR